MTTGTMIVEAAIAVRQDDEARFLVERRCRHRLEPGIVSRVADDVAAGLFVFDGPPEAPCRRENRQPKNNPRRLVAHRGPGCKFRAWSLYA